VPDNDRNNILSLVEIFHEGHDNLGIMHDLVTWCWHLPLRIVSVGNTIQTTALPWSAEHKLGQAASYQQEKEQPAASLGLLS